MPQYKRRFVVSGEIVKLAHLMACGRAHADGALVLNLVTTQAVWSILAILSKIL